MPAYGLAPLCSHSLLEPFCYLPFQKFPSNKRKAPNPLSLWKTSPSALCFSTLPIGLFSPLFFSQRELEPA